MTGGQESDNITHPLPEEYPQEGLRGQPTSPLETSEASWASVGASVEPWVCDRERAGLKALEGSLSLRPEASCPSLFAYDLVNAKRAVVDGEELFPNFFPGDLVI